MIAALALNPFDGSDEVRKIGAWIPSTGRTQMSYKTAFSDLGTLVVGPWARGAAPAVISMDAEEVSQAFVMAVEKVIDMSGLGENWDGYGAKAVAVEAIHKSIQLLARLDNSPDFPWPDAVPSPDGAVQLEWHRGGFDIEIAANPTGTFSLYRECQGQAEAPEEIEAHLVEAATTASIWLREMMQVR